MPTSNENNHKNQLLAKYVTTRQASLALCESLEKEDYGLQAMPEVSPPKWHLVHATWIFETFILKPFVHGYCLLHSRFEYLFSSYYNAIGVQYPPAQRGLLSRSTVKDVYDYRAYVDNAMERPLCSGNYGEREMIRQRCELGIHHEQQHQELFCTDIKYSFSVNPLYPALSNDRMPPDLTESPPFLFLELDAATTTIAYPGSGFHFDYEAPVHVFHQAGFRFANRLVTNAEYLEFIQDGGYDTAALWLADGWSWRSASDTRDIGYDKKGNGLNTHSMACCR